MRCSTLLLWMVSFSLAPSWVLAGHPTPRLITLEAANGDRSASEGSVCCRGPLILSCHKASLDPAVFTSRTDLHLPGTDHVFSFTNTVPPHGQHYTSAEGDEATLTLNPKTYFMFGTMQRGDRAFSLEHCEDGYVWVEYDIQGIEEEEEEEDIGEDGADDRQINDYPATQDNTTLEEFSVMIYYTPQFAAITPDIPGFVDQVLAETNQGYINSKVPMSIKLHCIEEATVNDVSTSSTSSKTVNNFVAMKESTAALRHSADAAVLLVASMGPSTSCGRAYGINTISRGETISACAKSCALGYFSFGHELAHSIGAYHNRETGHINPFYSYAQGHLIAKGSASTGYRSIMGYNANGHSRRVNYYSNPSVVFPATGTPTGTADSNNAAVLTRNRRAFGAVGDESMACKGTTPTPPSGGSSGGTVKSPGYPGNYPDDRDETFTLVAAKGKTIEVTFNTLDIEFHKNCAYDFVMAKDGDGTELMAKTCGSKTPPPLPFTSKINKVLIIFHSDFSENRKGFQLTWREVGSEPSGGSLMSPNYPATYPINLDKTFPIVVDSGKRIILTFTDFAVESHRACRFDYVKITEGDGTLLMDKTCGLSKPETVISRTNKVELLLHTDGSLGMKGFKLVWTAV